jgi:hypothetical protein
MDRKRIARGLALVAALAVALLLGQKWPKDQTVHYVLGDAAPRVEEVAARWAEGGGAPATDAWSREATFRFGRGQAPRVVTHQPRLPDGDYTVELEITADGRSPASPKNMGATNVVTRHVHLQGGGVTSIDLSPSVPQ